MNFEYLGVPEDVLEELRQIVGRDFEHSLILIGPKTEALIQKIAKNQVQGIGGLAPMITKDYWGDEKGKREWRVELKLGYTGTSVLMALKLPDMKKDYRNYNLSHRTIYYFD